MYFTARSRAFKKVQQSKKVGTPISHLISLSVDNKTALTVDKLIITGFINVKLEIIEYSYIIAKISSKISVFLVLVTFFPPNQIFAFSVGRSLRSQRIPMPAIAMFAM